MQTTSLPRWLRIVSSATAVLPVWRSPMISSRWPRPIGNMLSMAIRPVSIGWLTGWRAMMSGAGDSIGRYASASTGAPPSIGLPSASTTRPKKPSPTGMPATRFVR